MFGTLTVVKEREIRLINNSPLEIAFMGRLDKEHNEHIKFLKGLYLRNLLVAVARSLKVSDAHTYGYYGIKKKNELMFFCKNDSKLLMELLRQVDREISGNYGKVLSRTTVYKIFGLRIPIPWRIWLHRRRQNLSCNSTSSMAMLVAKNKLKQEGVDTDGILQNFVYDFHPPLVDTYFSRESESFCEKFGIDFVEREIDW